jgi:hypothetical protein
MAFDLSDPVSHRSRRIRVQFDLADFVNEAANRFERRRRGTVRISPAARHQLVKTMRPHERELLADLATGQMTVEKLESIMAGVLSLASAVTRSAGGRRLGRKNPRVGFKYKAIKYKGAVSDAGSTTLYVDKHGLLFAMKSKCRYLGWC